MGAVAFGASQAFFSDTETSEGNILQAGALDLKIDNTCYYNGQACLEGKWVGGENEGEECSCTWESKDLGEGDVFFDLHDLKPGDWEEDTISLNVDNPSWVCVDIKTTANDDVTCTEPEQEDELGACKVPGLGLGELADELLFVFWRDDGDNVFEAREENGIITQGLAREVLEGARWALADSEHGPGSLPAKETVYIGKFFCFGDITLDPVPDNEGVDPTVASGFKCDGKSVNNVSQTDLLAGDVVFEAVQARHNEDFLCNPTPTPTPSPTPTEAPTPTLSPFPTG